jgi:parallel beta-helix repeat protein
MKRLILVTFALMLFASTIYADSNVPIANAATSLPNYSLYSDGSGGTPSIHWDGAKFTLTADIEGTINLMDDGLVFDGAGFTVKGDGGSVGVAVYDKDAVTIKNVNVENFQIGILLGHTTGPGSFMQYDTNPNRCTNCTISNCQLSNNTNGISVAAGRQCRIIGNQATNNTKGISFYGSELVLRNNHMENNSINLEDMNLGIHDVDSSNIVNGKPIYYIVNQHSLTVPADAGVVYLKDCSNIIVKNLYIENAYAAIALFNSTDCRIYGNTLTCNNVGISLRDSANNSVIGNELLYNNDNAIEIYDSDNAIITNNLISSNGGGIDSIGYSISGSRYALISSNQIIENGGCGIQAGTNCTITGNHIEGNGQQGIYFWDMSNSTISKNNITKNGACGISSRNGIKASITGNDISKNWAGIEMGLQGDFSLFTITENNFAQNTNFAIAIYSDIKDSYFYRNNFIDNNNGSLQVTIKGRFVWHGDEGYDENSKVFPQYAASYNAWDKDLVGNYWSNYDSTVDGAVYKIDDNNIDHHPQKTPLQFAHLDTPKVGLEATLSSINASTESEVWWAVLPALVAGILAAVLLYRRRPKKQPDYSSSAGSA